MDKLDIYELMMSETDLEVFSVGTFLLAGVSFGMSSKGTNPLCISFEPL